MKSASTHQPLTPASPMCLHAPSHYLKAPTPDPPLPPLHQVGYFPVPHASGRLIWIPAGKGFLQEQRAEGSDLATVRGSMKSATWRVQAGDVPEANAADGWCKR